MTRAALVLALLALGCRPRDTTTIHYPRSTWEILNPERGFMIDIDLVGSRDYSEVRARGYTLGFAGVRLDAYREAPLPASLLENLAGGFEAVRDAGIKVVLRFVYNHDADGADAPKAWILAHIAQLQPILADNADVIAVMDAGFIGAWGEWHSSSNGLDNQRDRGDVLYAILGALPASRSVTVRSPIYKIAAYGTALTEDEAHDGSHPSRVGHHNSCFLASDTDLGTYMEPIGTWKEVVAQDGRFTPVGGETCQPNPPRSDCATAIEELARLHWSFLNALYHEEVLEAWQRQGCHERIGRDLGYRYELTSVSFEPRVAAGGTLHVTLRLANTGYAAMYNARPVYLMFDDREIATTLDPRRWEPGEPVTFTVEVPIPADAAPGPHRLGLWMPDADARLQTPERVGSYSVRLANTGWDSPINVLTEELIVSPRLPPR